MEQEVAVAVASIYRHLNKERPSRFRKRHDTNKEIASLKFHPVDILSKLKSALIFRHCLNIQVYGQTRWGELKYFRSLKPTRSIIERTKGNRTGRSANTKKIHPVLREVGFPLSFSFFSRACGRNEAEFSRLKWVHQPTSIRLPPAAPMRDGCRFRLIFS